MKCLLLALLTLSLSADAQIMNQAPAKMPDAMTPANSAPQPPADPLLDAARDLIGQPLILRCLCEDAKLAYDATGKPQEQTKKPVEWTLAGFDLKDVTRKDPEHVELSGVRVGIRYNDGAKYFDRKPLPQSAVHIEMTAPRDVPQMKSALDAIFYNGIERDLQLATPAAWQHYFNYGLKWPADGINDSAILRPDPKNPNLGVPKAIKKTDADLTLEAQQNHITGSVLLRIVIDKDGTPRRIAISKPIGFGLDMEAVKAMQKWKFAPAVMNGQYVPMEIYAELRFVPPPKPIGQ